MDFYAVKFIAASNLTGETYVGYIFGKKGQSPQFNVVVLNRSQLKEFEIPDITKDYLEFKSDVDMLYYQLSKEKDNYTLTQFKAYFYSVLRKMNFEIVGTKIFLAVEENDVYVLKSLINDILSEWAGETKIKLVAQKFDYKDLTWISAVKEKGEKGFEEYLNRPDVKNAKEVFPIIDPVEGYPVIKLDVGEPIIVLEIDREKEENREDPGNILEGKVISKELIPSTSYLFLKIDLGRHGIGKTIVHQDLKIAIDQNKIQILRKARDAQENEEQKVIGDLFDNLQKDNSFYDRRKISSFDIIIIGGFSIIAILLIILIAVLLGAF